MPMQLTDEYVRRCHDVTRLTALARRFDGIPHNARVTVFSTGNPYVSGLNRAIQLRDSYRRPKRDKLDHPELSPIAAALFGQSHFGG